MIRTSCTANCKVIEYSREVPTPLSQAAARADGTARRVASNHYVAAKSPGVALFIIKWQFCTSVPICALQANLNVDRITIISIATRFDNTDLPKTCNRDVHGESAAGIAGKLAGCKPSQAAVRKRGKQARATCSTCW